MKGGFNGRKKLLCLGGGSTNFSTEEQVVGTWIDGKPLYQKTVDCGMLGNNSFKDISANIGVVDNVTCLYGFAISNNEDVFPLPYVNDTSAVYSIQIYYTKSVDLIHIYYRGSNRADHHAYITMQYTKTTD